MWGGSDGGGGGGSGGILYFKYCMAAEVFYRWTGLGATKLFPSTCLILESDVLPLSVVRSIIPVAGKVLAVTAICSIS